MPTDKFNQADFLGSMNVIVFVILQIHVSFASCGNSQNREYISFEHYPDSAGQSCDVFRPIKRENA